MCSLAGHIRLEGLAPLRSGRHVITDRHTHTLTRSVSKCSIESIVYPVRLRTAQEKLHETPCLLQRSARLRPDLKWIHLSTSWPDLTWMSRSLAREASCSLAFSFSFHVLSLLLSHPDVWTEVCERLCSSVYMQGCVVAHMRKAAEGYLCFLIFFIVFDVLSWSSRSRSWNNFPNGYLWPSENMSYHRGWVSFGF